MNLLETLRKQKFLSFSLLLFTLSVGILIGTLLNTRVRAEKGQAASDATPLTIPNPVQLSTSFSQLAKRLEPSVVNITTDFVPKETRGSRDRRRPANPDDEDEDQGSDLFHRFFGFPGGDQRMPQFRREATGSGFIVDANGYILTNNHVVENASRIKVRLTGDPADYEAKLIGTDSETDLAVIKITSSNRLVAAKIGNSDAVQVGDWAVAIGSPFGLDTTVTAGIISAKGRDFPNQQFQHFLQTDAAINPGNSGGPLLNINGEVVGVNTAIATQSGGYQGVGFALPINTAVTVYNQIIRSGKVTRGSIGVQLSVKPPQELFKVYGASGGAFVNSVQPGSPADKAGLKEGDVIIAFNGRPLKSGDDLVNAVAESPVGSDQALTVMRDGKKRDTKVTIADRRQIWAGRLGVAPAEEPGRGEATEAKFGLYVRNLSQGDKEELGYSGSGGVIITKVEPESFGEDVGLRPNDILISINRQTVESVDDVRRIQSSLKPGNAVAFHVKRAFSPFGRGRGRPTAEWTSVFPAGTLPSAEKRP